MSIKLIVKYISSWIKFLGKLKIIQISSYFIKQVIKCRSHQITHYAQLSVILLPQFYLLFILFSFFFLLKVSNFEFFFLKSNNGLKSFQSMLHSPLLIVPNRKGRALNSIKQTFDIFPCFFFASWFFPDCSLIYHYLQKQCSTMYNNLTKLSRLGTKVYNLGYRQ